jgi:hypothetical protein
MASVPREGRKTGFEIDERTRVEPHASSVALIYGVRLEGALGPARYA